MSKNLKNSILEHFKCSLCHHYMHPPIFQCSTGHSFCQECFESIEDCSICGTEKSSSIRNFSLESLHAKLKFPCAFASIGCHFTGTEDIANHQAQCSFRWKRCPMEDLAFCEWRGDRTDFADHLAGSHANEYLVGDEQHVVIKNLEAAVDRTYRIVYAFNEFFRLVYELQDPNGEEGGSKWALHYLGTEEEAEKRNFSYKIEFLSSSDSDYNSLTTLMYQTKVTVEKEFDFDFEKPKIFVKHRHINVHRSVLNRCCDGSDLIVRVTIFDNEKKM